jgi:hypothetical protein
MRCPSASAEGGRGDALGSYPGANSSVYRIVLFWISPYVDHMYASRSSRRHAGYGALHHHLRARIETCRFLREEAVSTEEKEGWLAEEAGLTDALLGRSDRFALPSDPSGQRDRYVVGLQDGRSILVAAKRPSTFQRNAKGEG